MKLCCSLGSVFEDGKLTLLESIQGKSPIVQHCPREGPNGKSMKKDICQDKSLFRRSTGENLKDLKLSLGRTPSKTVKK